MNGDSKEQLEQKMAALKNSLIPPLEGFKTKNKEFPTQAVVAVLISMAIDISVDHIGR